MVVQHYDLGTGHIYIIHKVMLIQMAGVGLTLHGGPALPFTSETGWTTGLHVPQGHPDLLVIHLLTCTFPELLF